MSYRAGFLALIGQPNAGKSTLMNFLVKEKVSIVSSKPQTTRRRTLGIWNDPKGQIVFVDAPGLVEAEKGLNGFLSQEAKDVMKDADAVLAVLSLDEAKPEDAEKTLELVAAAKKPWAAVITKTDLADKGHRLLILRSMVEKHGGRVLTISALRKDRDAEEDRRLFLEELWPLIPEAPAPLYDVELFTPETSRTLVAEIVREKCFEFLHQEIPFSIATRVLLYDEESKIPRIAVEILVAKENHKAIVIGKGGQVLKQIGSEARKDIEKLLGEQVFLELKVTFRDDWTGNKRIMKELGYVHDTKG